ncbi:hypothetical protein [Burkholderia gladioli]|uniref:hypothetical protein n=1 Tax=Burkholderia gladioli TaxID=28095 RepID=UPI0005D83550|nr:hypothetical protein [Burkholderia gladioli]AJW97425.1 hypothetical protein BM43_3459 [Burkholderia gladioli]KAF1061936.1 hypothetical protein LvStA_00549 [Burkholderia gladioli]MBU9177064.1 hypothetical protein [Burkholderia gladioli]MBU9323638.1 hypothetical protein [Burkholderia gladioli]MBU9645555.1 hypothetical protein [Burkholderia gladioli]
MNKPGLVTIGMNELQRVKVIESAVKGRLTGVRAAETWFLQSVARRTTGRQPGT